MTTRSQALSTLTHTGFRLGVGLFSLIIVLWIGVVGLVAVVFNPYLIAALWILGLAGLLACVGACLNTFPSPGQGKSVPHPVRALFCLLAGVAIGLSFWSAAYQSMGQEPLGVAVFEAIMALGGVFWLVLMALAAAVLRIAPEGREATSAGKDDRRSQILELPARESMA